MSTSYFLTVQRDERHGPLDWVFGLDRPASWAFGIGRMEVVDGAHTSRYVACGSGFTSPGAAFEAGGEVLARYDAKAVPHWPSPVQDVRASDEEALRLQIQASRRDVHCVGVH